jgi:hypothetical protein
VWACSWWSRSWPGPHRRSARKSFCPLPNWPGPSNAPTRRREVVPAPRRPGRGCRQRHPRDRPAAVRADPPRPLGAVSVGAAGRRRHPGRPGPRRFRPHRRRTRRRTRSIRWTSTPRCITAWAWTRSGSCTTTSAGPSPSAPGGSSRRWCGTEDGRKGQGSGGGGGFASEQ